MPMSALCISLLAANGAIFKLVPIEKSAVVIPGEQWLRAHYVCVYVCVLLCNSHSQSAGNNA